MSAIKYRNQVRLLLDVLPEVASEDCFAMHGGTAINLFVRDMPRLSVDIDLTYLPIADRGTTITNIVRALRNIQARIRRKFPNVRVSEPVETPGQTKLACSRPGAQIKIEVNTTMRGSLKEPTFLTLCKKAQEAFDQFVEMRIMPTGQLYGGKICAALDRQHPRDLFDIKYMLQNERFDYDVKRGFLLSLLSSDRPIHEMIQPSLLDQRSTMANHFAGMAEEPFSYDEFESTRITLIEKINHDLGNDDRQFLISFKEGTPEWGKYGFAEFEQFPAVQWKLQNIRNLKANNPMKYTEQLNRLKEKLRKAY